jgi:hypothetical protein
MCGLGGIALSLGLLPGCVERRMTIVSDPPGAAVIVNGKDIGAAPVDVPSKMFMYYGDYDITLLRDGFEPALIRQAVPKPWYQCFPLDFVSENLVPWHIHDKRLFSYQLQPPAMMPPENLLERANDQRMRARTIVPATPIAETVPVPRPPQPEELPPPARLGTPIVEPPQ